MGHVSLLNGCFSLYPYQFLTEYSEKLQRRSVLASIIALGMLDIGEKSVRGDLFEPWYYLLMILYVILLAAAPLGYRLVLNFVVRAANRLFYNCF